MNEYQEWVKAASAKGGIGKATISNNKSTVFANLIEKEVMKMLKKILSSVGIGSAKVDTQLTKNVYYPGEALEGTVVIQGGNTEQRIDEIYLTLKCTYTRKLDDKKYEDTAVVEKFKLLDSFLIYPNENKRIPFSLSLPYDTPLTKGKTQVWIQTGLDIKMAIDPQDRDYIQIQPHPLLDAFLQAANQLGFRLREIECEEVPRSFRRRLPFVQEFEFKPSGGMFRGKLDELEAIFHVSEHQVEVILEIDRKARGFRGFLSEALDMDESHVRFTYGPNDVHQLASSLSNIIQRYS